MLWLRSRSWNLVLNLFAVEYLLIFDSFYTNILSHLSTFFIRMPITADFCNSHHQRGRFGSLAWMIPIPPTVDIYIYIYIFIANLSLSIYLSMSIPLLSYSIYIISIYITLIYLLRSFSSEWMCVYFFKSCIQFTHANQKPFRRSSQVGFWQHTNCLGDEEGATLRLTRDPPPPWTNERTTRSQWTNCVSSVSLPSVDEKEKSLKSAIIYASRGRGIFIFLPYSFFSFLFFFSLSIYNSQAIFIGENDKKKKKGIESNREIDHPSRTNQPPFSRAIICMTRLSVFVANYLLRSCKSLLHSLLLLLYSYLLLSLFFWLLLFDY